MLQGRGRPAIIAKLHAMELVPYDMILWIGVVLAGRGLGLGAAGGRGRPIDVRASGLRARVFSVLWFGMALIAAADLAMQLTANMPVARGVAATAVLMAAIAYSLRVAPNDLRLILARALSLKWSRLAAMQK
jgi:hypothetical protein